MATATKNKAKRGAERPTSGYCAVAPRDVPLDSLLWPWEQAPWGEINAAVSKGQAVRIETFSGQGSQEWINTALLQLGAQRIETIVAHIDREWQLWIVPRGSLGDVLLDGDGLVTDC